MNTDICPDCNQTIQYDPNTFEFDTHDISPSMRSVCVGSNTVAPVGIGTPQALQSLFGGQIPPGFPGTGTTTFDPPVKKRRPPRKMEQLANALLSDNMAPPPVQVPQPQPGVDCNTHGLKASPGVACGFCQMEWEAQQPIEFKADHDVRQPKHLDGSPCTNTDQCPWSYAAYSALQTEMGKREFNEVVDRLSGAKDVPLVEHVVPTDFYANVDEPQAPKVNNTGLPDDVAASLGLL